MGKTPKFKTGFVLFKIITRRAILALLCVFMAVSATGCWKKSPAGQNCKATLLLGSTQYAIQVVKPERDGKLTIPKNYPYRAYWVEGTEINAVYGLSPTTTSLTLQTSLKTGDEVTVTLKNCNSTKYSISTITSGAPETAALLDQSFSGITIFARSSAAAGFVIRGDLLEETITHFNTPNPAEIQAEVSLLETTSSEDGKALIVSISILNTGQTALTLNTEDVFLVAQDAAAGVPQSAEPALPAEIKAGASQSFSFTFPKPSTLAVTIKVFSVEFELDGY